MITIQKLLSTLIVLAAAAGGLSSCATTGLMPARLDARTAETLDAMSAKLAAAKTLRVTATRTVSPGFQAGIDVPQKASGTVAVKRPDHLVAQVKTDRGRRTIAFDGGTLTLIDHAAGTHATVAAKGDIDEAVQGVRDTYGFAPPVAELLANDPRSLLLEGVKTGTHTGTETIGGVKCDRFAFVQDQLTWQLWVGADDRLPRRIALTYPNAGGGDPLTMSATITKWELDAPLSEADMSVTVPSGSRELEMIPIQPQS